jgi:hypothetical protein
MIQNNRNKKLILHIYMLRKFKFNDYWCVFYSCIGLEVLRLICISGGAPVFVTCKG